ncbi:autophagy protein Apg6-domain-containing protein [Obelidium mucronatum]|nr:autophagy protein Apg6-domain-containing protein [Obelidium mucronatum]
MSLACVECGSRLAGDDGWVCAMLCCCVAGLFADVSARQDAAERRQLVCASGAAAVRRRQPQRAAQDDGDAAAAGGGAWRLCRGCVDEVQLRIETRVADARRERDAYAAFVRSAGGGGGERELRADDASGASFEDALLELEELEREAARARLELDDALRELKALDRLEAQYWQDVNALQMQTSEVERERDSFNFKHAAVLRQLERLEKTNVFNDAFRIWHDGPFGTINGFRLGRLPTQPVEWHEINAALGQAVLLLDILATKLGFVFQTYKLVPMGSFSRIEKIGDASAATNNGEKTAYELYGSNDFTVLLFWNRRFDSALVAFLNCIQQLGDFVQQRDPKLKLPYSIHKDRIGDASIRVQFNQDDQWTRALNRSESGASSGGSAAAVFSRRVIVSQNTCEWI